MLSEFGKYIRKYRIDNSKSLKDMASDLNVTPSYLSAIELGKRNIPKNWETIIVRKYHLNKLQTEELKHAIIKSQKIFKINLEGYSYIDKQLILTFIGKFKDLSKDEKNRIIQIIRSA